MIELYDYFAFLPPIIKITNDFINFLFSNRGLWGLEMTYFIKNERALMKNMSFQDLTLLLSPLLL